MPHVSSPAKIYFMNGMTTTKEEAKATAQKLREITGCKVHLHHNDTTPASEATAAAAEIIFGLIGAIYAAVSDKKTNTKKAIDTAIGIGSTVAIADGLRRYHDIQVKKNETAKRLTAKVARYLRNNPRAHVTLVLHSQGADIADRLNLSRYRDRIRVVTLGGMIPIAHKFAFKVINIQHERDLISRGAHAIFDINQAPRTVHRIKAESCDTFACHGTEDYLAGDFVKGKLRQMTTPRALHYRAG